MPERAPLDAHEPRGEIEIIPPEESVERRSSGVFIWSGGREFRIVKLGPAASALLTLALGAVALLSFVFLAGFLLFLVPILAVIFAVLYFSGGRNNPFRRLR